MPNKPKSTQPYYQRFKLTVTGADGVSEPSLLKDAEDVYREIDMDFDVENATALRDSLTKKIAEHKAGFIGVRVRGRVT